MNCYIRPGGDAHSDLGSHHRLDERMLAEQAGGESSSLDFIESGSVW